MNGNDSDRWRSTPAGCDAGRPPGAGGSDPADTRQGWDLSLRPVRVETNGADEQGRLVFHDGKLVAVLVRLSDGHADAAGQWFLEHGFGALDGPCHPSFPDLDAARAWISRRRGQRR